VAGTGSIAFLVSRKDDFGIGACPASIAAAARVAKFPDRRGAAALPTCHTIILWAVRWYVTYPRWITCGLRYAIGDLFLELYPRIEPRSFVLECW
jgi:hypothetical protein